MKLNLFALLAASLLLCACNKDENEQKEVRNYDSYNPPHEGMMMDAAYITKLELYIMDKEILWLSGFYIPAVYLNEYTRKDREPLFSDFSSVKMYAVFEKSGNGIPNDTSQIAKNINNLVYDWFFSKTDFILEQYRQSQIPSEWPVFFTSYINEGVQLTCDKVLFGQQPGEDLSQHFKVTPPYYYLPVGREQPGVQYSFVDEDTLRAGVPMPDFFTKDSWMQSAYLIRFIDEPSERYDNLTFTIKFPASLEHVREFCTSKYEGKNAPMRVTDTTFTASFKAKFNWDE